MRTRLVLLLLAAAGCVSPGRGGAGREQEAWRKDWLAFWEAVAPYARAGAIEHNRDAIAFNRVFGGGGGMGRHPQVVSFLRRGRSLRRARHAAGPGSPAGRKLGPGQGAEAVLLVAGERLRALVAGARRPGGPLPDRSPEPHRGNQPV